MTMQPVPRRIAGNTFEDILNAEASVLSLQTSHFDTLLQQFHDRIRYSGQTVYVWHENEGLRSLRETGVRVPGCLRLGDTLRYVLKRRHFGIYLLAGLKPPLASTNILLLRRTARAQVDFVRRVVLVSDGPELAEHLDELQLPVLHYRVPQLQLRLRDGRWVV